ncbi:hypothetical protein WA026_020645 [Henosepilachna vigintioctopunctata]|uniref:AMP-dependent synthetase/ligase domain-containing protein n=1 Tax=Henosepilachna vigintioctopunctata TaxID=420089 RepID=A0AAW1UBB9_9CUCU
MYSSSSSENSKQNKEEEYAEDDNPLIVKRFGELELPQYGLGYEIFQAMKRNSLRVAQYIADTNHTETFGELLENCIRVAINLKYDQFSADDAIGLSSINHQYTCVPYIAAMFLGVKVVAFDTSLSVTDRIYLFQQLAPKVLFVDVDILPSIEESISKGGFNIKIVVFGEDGNGHIIFSDYLVATEEEISNFEPIKLQSNRDTAAILFSSGTTGMPKGICVSHYGLLSQALLVILSGDTGDDENPVIMTFTELYWISSIDFLMAALVGGIARVIAANYDPEELWGHIEKYRVCFCIQLQFTLFR